MILGISHLAYATNRFDYYVDKLIARGGTCKFIEKNLLSSSSKAKMFIGDLTPKSHDIALFNFNSTEGHKYSIEIINHHIEPSKAAGCYEIKNACICANTYSAEKELAFWNKVLGLPDISREKNSISFKSVVPTWSFNIEFHTKKDILPESSTLNSSGYNCIAFYCRNLENLQNRCKNYSDCYCTEIFNMEINNRVLKIFMIKTVTGLPIEFIEV